MKPDDPELVEAVEQLAHHFYDAEEKEHHFTFIYGEANWDTYPFSPHPKAVKAWIVRSRRLHPDEWHRSQAVVLSYRGKRTLRLNVAVKGDEQAYQLNVDLKTGKLTWKRLNTRTAEQLKEALKVAQR